MSGEYHCAYCGRRHADRGDRLACCSDRPLPGDAIADGGHPAIQNSRAVAVLRGLRGVLTSDGGGE